MANISALGNLQSVEELNLNDGQYADQKQSTFVLPPKGEYVLRAPDAFPEAAFGATKAGYLKVQIDPTIVGPTNEGFQLRYQSVSAKTFPRGGAIASQLGDYLRACGYKGAIKSPQDQADAAEATAGTVYNAILDWRVFNSKTGFQLEGMTKFPRNADGSYQSWVEDPGDKDEQGNPKRLRANLFISRFLPAAS